MPGVAAKAGAGVAFGAFVALCILALAVVIPAWAAALIVTAVFGAVAGVAALTGKKKVQKGAPPVPEQTVESVDFAPTIARAIGIAPPSTVMGRVLGEALHGGLDGLQGADRLIADLNGTTIDVAGEKDGD